MNNNNVMHLLCVLLSKLMQTSPCGCKLLLSVRLNAPQIQLLTRLIKQIQPKNDKKRHIIEDKIRITSFKLKLVPLNVNLHLI